MNRLWKDLKSVPVSPAGHSQFSGIGLSREEQDFATRAVPSHSNCQFNPRQDGHRYFGNEEVRGIILSGLESLKGLSEKAGIEAPIAQNLREGRSDEDLVIHD